MKRGSLSRSRDFRRVYDEGRRTRRDGVAIVALARGDHDPARIGFSVTSSAGGAVTRNRIKRRLRSAVTEVDVASGFDIVVSGDVTAAQVDFQVLVESLGEAASAAGATR